jgi:hypothetical protein
MVQVWGCDDSQLFAIFSVIFITFWSSQARLSSKKSKKSKKNRRFRRNSCVDVFIESVAILDSLGV